MLDLINAHSFLPWLGHSCRATVGDIAFELHLETVDEGRHPPSGGAGRTPFCVLLRGPLESAFQYGLFTLEIAAGPTISNVYIERTAPPSPAQAEAAYYQIVFA
jgi:hypothetical protein